MGRKQFPGDRTDPCACLACSYIGLVSSIVLEALEAGALKGPRTYPRSRIMHFSRIFGGAAGAAILTRFISVRERYHSKMPGLQVQSGGWLAEDRLQMLTGGLFPGSTGPEESQYRALGILSQQVRAQAYTMAIADGLILIAWVVVAYLLLMLLCGLEGQLQRLEEHAMNRVYFYRVLATAGVATLGVPQMPLRSGA